jgi:hypothetical protein
MSFIGATGLDEVQEQFDTLNDKIDANADYINNLVGIPDPTHTAIFGINILNPGLFGLVERAEVNIAALQTGEEGLGTDLSALTTQVEGIQGEITGIQGEITALEGQISAVEGSISFIQFTELPAIGTAIAAAAGVAGDALGKANKSLGIWDEDGNNTYNMKSGNVAIGILPKGTLLNNKLEVNGSINIPTNSKYKINNVPLSYSDLAGTPPVSSKWTNATDVANNIYYNTGNVGIGITTAINNKLEVGGNLNISAGSKYKINNVNLAFSDLGGTLSYNSLTDKLTAGTNISIVGNAINNTYTYTLPTASTSVLGGVRVDGSTINITNGVISAAAATPQVNSDWTQTNDNLKSFIQNKPTAGNNISFANNTITNTITGSPTQNIIGLNTNQLIVVDKPNSQKIDEVFVPLTNEPTITSPAFTQSIRTFTHSGGTEEQTSYTITIGQNTICDILIVGGGGGGGYDRAAGGGAGGLLLYTDMLVNAGTYTIKVGKGGIGDTGYGTRGTLGNGFSSSIEGLSGAIALGGGRGGTSGNTTNEFPNSGGSGGGGAGNSGWTTNTGSSGTSGQGNSGGSMVATSGSFNSAGGGGAGGNGGNGLQGTNPANSGNGGIGRDMSSYFGTSFGQSGWFAGGGGGSQDFGSFASAANSTSSRGGQGGGGNAGLARGQSGSNGLAGTGGGGGGGANISQGSGGNGGSGIVIIKFKTIVNSAISEGNPITHKTLNFTYDLTKYAEYLAQQKTGVGGWRIVRFLPPNLNRWYQGDYISTSTFTIPTIGTPYNYTNEWAVSFGTFDEMFFGTFDMTYWLYCLKTSVLGSYGAVARPIIKSSSSSTPYNAIWYNRGTNGEDPWISIGDHPSLVVYGENNTNVNMSLLNAYGGMCVLVRDSTASTTIPNPNQYTLSVPLSGTGVIINNTPLQYLSAGNYTISVGATQSSVVIAGIGQVGSDPYPLTNGSTITFKYSMTQRIQTSVFYKKDGLIKYVPASGTNPTTGTWQMIDVDSQALTQFAGNLPFTRIDGNVPLTRIEGNVSGKIPISSTDGNLPASRIDNLALSLGMDLTGVNGATQIKLTSGIVVVQGNLYSTGVNYYKYNVWHLDSDGFERFYFQQSNTTYIKGHGTTPFEFRNGANTNICTISGSGGLAVASYLQGSGAGGGFRLVRPDDWVRMKSTDETTHLNFAAQNIYAYGTLDAQGITYLNNFTYVKMQSIANTGIEYVCVVGNDAQGAYYNKALYIAYGTFTGFHRCYIEDELCNDENVDIFKNEYIGRVVISTGKIKTDASRKKEGEENEHEWYSLEGKEGITIEDALPIIQLSRIRKDKRVYGVLGDPKRGTNNNSRIIVNGCGEGAICVANTNGNIENGDYIQTSDLLGYGEKQDDDLHRNYTIAKAVMDCTFELDNPNYECKELASGVRVAMIACVYKAS